MHCESTHKSVLLESSGITPTAVPPRRMAFLCRLEDTGVANAPTRRHPSTYTAQRRPQKGPRPVAGSIRQRAASGVAKLKQYGDHDEAAAIAALLGPRGYLLLQRTEEGETSPLSLTVSTELAQALRSAADEFELVLDGLAEEAYRLVLDGAWLPEEMGRGKGGPRATVQLQVDKQLRQQVQAIMPQLKERAGYRITESNIVISYICEELGIERSNTAKADSLEMRFPKSLVQHWEQAAAAQGLTLRAVAMDGVRDLVQGKASVPNRNPYFTKEKRGPRVRAWAESDRQRLWLPMDKGLLTDLREVAEALTEVNGYLVHPGSIIRAILTDRLGEPAE